MNESTHPPKYKVRKALSVDERNAVGGISDVVAHLLFHRGISDRESAEKFLAPDYAAHILDPFLLKDAEKAADRIILAIENNERITLYSDYDADGIPGAVMWNDFFKRLGYTNYSIYIPHRHNEGFGLNVEAVEQLANEGMKLLITLDCGISDIEPVRRANELGIEVIITDHHEPPVVLPSAFAIIDHKQIDCVYPDKNICGTGVGFKLIQAIIKKIQDSKVVSRQSTVTHSGYSRGTVEKTQDESDKKIVGEAGVKKFELNWKEGHEKWFLDMVGIATLSDMVPLIGENRVFAYYGMSVLRKSPRKGLIKLLSKLKISQPHLTEDDIGFMVTPRINAASRMGVPMDAFKLLAAETDEDAKFYADHLDEINNERKGIVASLVKEVKKIIKERYGNNLPHAIVLGNPDWKPSLLGLVANTCAEEFDRPVFLWGRDGDNVIKGSCRSEGTSNIVEIMRGVPTGVFMQFGGHKHSGGFAVDNEQVHFLEKQINEAVEKVKSRKSKATRELGERSSSRMTVEKVQGDSGEKSADDFDGEYVDMELTLDVVNWRLQEDIDKLAPFGMSNPKPLFLFKNVKPASMRKFGKTLGHVEIGFMRSNGAPLAAIAFFAADLEWVKVLEADKNKSIDLVASIEKSMFRGRKELRLRVVDIIL